MTKEKPKLPYKMVVHYLPKYVSGPQQNRELIKRLLAHTKQNEWKRVIKDRVTYYIRSNNSNLLVTSTLEHLRLHFSLRNGNVQRNLYLSAVRNSPASTIFSGDCEWWIRHQWTVVQYSKWQENVAIERLYTVESNKNLRLGVKKRRPP